MMAGNRRSVFFSEAPDTDLTLVERNYGVSQNILTRFREQGIRPPYTLKEGKAVERKENASVNLNGEFQYVVYRNEAGEIDINIGSGAHYVIGEGRSKVIIAGNIEFSEGVPVKIENGSGTYHYNYRLGNAEKLTKIYHTQEEALKKLQISQPVIFSMQRYISVKEAEEKAEEKARQEIQKRMAETQGLGNTQESLASLKLNKIT